LSGHLPESMREREEEGKEGTNTIIPGYTGHVPSINPIGQSRTREVNSKVCFEMIRLKKLSWLIEDFK